MMTVSERKKRKKEKETHKEMKKQREIFTNVFFPLSRLKVRAKLEMERNIYS